MHTRPPRYAEDFPNPPWLLALAYVALAGGILGLLYAEWHAPAAARSWDALARGAGLILLIGLLYGVLQFRGLTITVGPEELVFGFGRFRKRVRLRDLRDCRVVTYRWQDYGGYGIRRGRDGTVAYNVPGDRGKAVRLTVGEGPKTRVYLLSTQDPERLCAVLRELTGTG